MSDVGNVHSGEVEGELEGVLRTLLVAAGRMGENIAQAREEAARRAEAESIQKARELQAQYEQERALARAQVRPINEPAWWDRASVDDIANAYHTTSAWKDNDQDLAQAHAKMGDELRERYGVDVNDLGADPQRVGDLLRERAAAGGLVDGQGSTQAERREADDLLNAADRHDRAAEAGRTAAAEPATDNDRDEELAVTTARESATSEQAAGDQDRSAGESAWDSADRRDSHVEQMAAQGVEPIAIQAQYGADVSNAKHPRTAVTSTRGAAKARKAVRRAPGVTRERGERSR